MAGVKNCSSQARILRAGKSSPETSIHPEFERPLFWSGGQGTMSSPDSESFIKFWGQLTLMFNSTGKCIKMVIQHLQQWIMKTQNNSCLTTPGRGRTRWMPWLPELPQ